MRRTSPFGWAIAVLTATVCLSIGSPLLGLRVFFPVDLLQAEAPWSEHAPAHFRRTNPILEDPVNAFMPMRAEFRRRLFAGDYPLWTDYPSGGVPLAAVPNNGLLSPFNLPFVTLPLWYAPAAAKLLEMAFAAIFMWLFLRRVGVTALPSLVGAMAYVNSAFQVVWTNWPHSHIGALIPALFWATELLINKRELRWALPATAVITVMLLEGFPPVTFYALFACTAYLLVRLWVTRGTDRRPPSRVLLAFGVAVLLSGGLAALQLLPSWRQLTTLDLSYRRQTPGAHLPVRALATLVVPNAFGSPTDGNYFGSLHYGRPSYVVLNYQELQSFIGATALVLIVFHLIIRARTRGDASVPVRGLLSYLWVGTALSAVLIYAGGFPLKMLQLTPFFRLNFIGRARSVFEFLLATLAAVGFHDLIAQREPKRRAAWLPSLMLILVVSGLAVGFVSWWQLVGEAHQRRYVARQALIPLLAGALAIGAVLVRHRRRLWGHPLVAWVIPLLIGLESVVFALPFLPRVPKEFFYPSTAAHRFLQRSVGHDRIASGGKAMDPGTTTFYSLRAVTAHVFVDPSWRQLITATDPTAFRPTGPTYPILDTSERVAASPILDRLSVRYFVNPPNIPVFGTRLPAPAATGAVDLRPGSSLIADLTATKLQAVALNILGGWESLDGNTEIRVEVADRAGRVAAVGTRRLPQGNPRDLEIAIPENVSWPLTPRSLRVRITLRGSGGHLTLAASRGQPALAVVVPRHDGLRVVFGNGAVVYERRRALPRIRWARRAIVIPDFAGRLAAMARSPLDTLILTKSGPAPSGKDARLRILKDAEDEIRIGVSAGGDGYLVVADALHQGWNVWVDGERGVLRSADHALASVFVPAGRHDVTFRYEPTEFKVGRYISLVTIFGIAAIAFGPAWLTRRRRAHPG